MSVAIPHTQRSWIGKAHMIGQDVTASYIYLNPGDLGDNHYEGPFDVPQYESSKNKTTSSSATTATTTTSSSSTSSAYPTKEHEWVLLDATPASCANIGIHHLFKHKSPVDLVISGPNFGRNSTALYIMSSGTVGAAMEAALCGVKSIGLSYAYETRVHDHAIIDEASKLSVKLIDYLYNNWDTKDGVQLYSVNVPLVKSLNDQTRILYAHILQNQWGPVFEPFEDYEHRIEQGEEDNEIHIGVPSKKLGNIKSATISSSQNTTSKENHDTNTSQSDSNSSINSSGNSSSNNNNNSNKTEPHIKTTTGKKEEEDLSEETNGTVKRNKALTQFKWKPDYQAVRDSVKESPEGNDGWAVDQGYISVTPLRACFHVVNIKGDINLK